MSPLQEDPRSMYPDEYDKYMDLKEIAYGRTRKHFLNSNPYAAKRENFVPEEHLIIKESGRVVSHLRLLLMKIIAGDCTMKAGAVGEVGTHPDYRGRGHMESLLRNSVERMREKKIVLSILSGNTQRYRHFGWEMAGRKMVFRLNQRSTKEVIVGSEFTVKGYDGEADLDRVMTIHEREPLRIERTERNYQGILARGDIDVWMGNEGGLDCYAVLKNDAVIEFGGKPSLVAKLFSFLLSTYPLTTLCVDSPYVDSEMLRSLYRVSFSWQISPQWMIKVIDLKETLLSFRPQIQEKGEICEILEGSAVTLRIKDGQQWVTLVKEDRIETKTEESGDVIPLSEIEIVRLLFGPSPEDFGRNNQQKNFLRAIFPLSFFVGWLDHI